MPSNTLTIDPSELSDMPGPKVQASVSVRPDELSDSPQQDSTNAMSVHPDELTNSPSLTDRMGNLWDKAKELGSEVVQGTKRAGLQFAGKALKEGVFPAAAGVGADIVGKGVRSVAELPTDVASIYDTFRGDKENADKRAQQSAEIDKSLRDVQTSLIPSSDIPQDSSLGTATSVGSLMAGGTSSVAKGVAKRAATREAIKKGAEESIAKQIATGVPEATAREAIDIATKEPGVITKSLQSGKDFAKGELLYGSGVSNTPGSLLAPDDQQGTPFTRRVVAPLEGFGLGVAGELAATGVGSLARKGYTQAVERTKAAFQPPLKFEGDTIKANVDYSFEPTATERPDVKQPDMLEINPTESKPNVEAMKEYNVKIFNNAQKASTNLQTSMNPRDIASVMSTQERASFGITSGNVARGIDDGILDDIYAKRNQSDLGTYEQSLTSKTANAWGWFDKVSRAQDKVTGLKHFDNALLDNKAWVGAITIAERPGRLYNGLVGINAPIKTGNMAQRFIPFASEKEMLPGVFSFAPLEQAGSRGSGELVYRPDVKNLVKLRYDAYTAGAKQWQLNEFDLARNSLDDYTNIDRLINDAEGKLREEDSGYKIYFDHLRDISKNDNFEEASKQAAQLRKDIENDLTSEKAKVFTDKDDGILNLALRRSNMSRQEAEDLYVKYETSPWTKQYIKDTSDFNKYLLDLRVDNGDLSATTRDRYINAHPNYLPSYKTVVDLTADSEYYGYNKYSSDQKRTISSRQNIDPTEAYYRYVRRVSDNVERNRAGTVLLNELLQYGDRDFSNFFRQPKADVLKAIEKLKQGKTVGIDLQNNILPKLSDNYAPETRDAILKAYNDIITKSENNVTVRVNGQSLTLTPRDMDLFHMFDQSSRKFDEYAANRSAARKVWQSMFRDFAVVYSPNFWARTFQKEVVWDQLMNQSGNFAKRFSPGKGAKNLFLAELDPTMYAYHVANYGFGDSRVGWKELRGSTEEQVQASLTRTKKMAGEDQGLLDKAKDVAGAIPDAAHSISQRLDFTHRITYYNRLIKEGIEPGRALYLSQNLGVNFLKRPAGEGSFLGVIPGRHVYTMPFFRTWQNSLDNQFKIMRHRTSTFVGTAATLGTAAWLYDNFTDTNQPREEKRSKVRVPVRDTYVSLEKGGYATQAPAVTFENTLDYLETQLYKHAPDVFINTVKDHLGEDAAKKVEAHIIKYPMDFDLFMRELGTNTAQATTPFLAPYAQAWRLASGTDYRGRDIVPSYLESDVNRTQEFYADTPQVYVGAAKFFQKALGISATDATSALTSPLRLQAAIDDFFPNVVDFGARVVSQTMSGAGIGPEQAAPSTVADYPFVRGIVNPKAVPWDEDAQRYTSVWRIANQSYKQKLDLEKQVESDPDKKDDLVQFTEENRHWLDIHDLMGPAQKRINELQRRITDVAQDKDPTYTSPDGSRPFLGSDAKKEFFNNTEQQIRDIQRDIVGTVHLLPYGDTAMKQSIQDNGFVDMIAKQLGVKGKLGEVTPSDVYNNKADSSVYDKMFDSLKLPKAKEGDEDKPILTHLSERKKLDAVQAIRMAAMDTSVNPVMMLKLADLESHLGELHQNPNSSASGLSQFTDSTWREVVKKWGDDFGIKVEEKNNYYAQAVMTAELLKENHGMYMLRYEELPNLTDLYTMHLLGTGGGIKFLDALHDSPGALASKVNPEAAKNNTSVFYNGSGKARTVKQVYDYLSGKLDTQPKERLLTEKE